LKAVQKFQAQIYVLTKDEGKFLHLPLNQWLTLFRWTLHSFHEQLPPSTFHPYR
jgi:hypothetical protein